MAHALEIPLIEQFTQGNAEEIEEQPIVQKPPRIERLKTLFEQNQTIRTIRVLIPVLDHGHPHIFFLRRTTTKNLVLPGGKLVPGEDDDTGLQRLLSKKLNLIDGTYDSPELIATWYRPQFTDKQYPYKPVHVSTPKEIELWYFVNFPEKGHLYVSSKYELTAIPFYDLICENYGPEHSIYNTIPLLFSRYEMIPKLPSRSN